jgi:Mrp family chromosome partitioning ATPase
LARALSADGASVLLIDADVRKSHPLSDALGLGQALAGECELTQAISTVTFPETMFDFLPPGDVKSPDMISLARLRRLIEQARERFDFVVIDSASFPVVSDALIVSQVADAMVTVIRPGHTMRARAESYFARVGWLSATHFLIINDSEVAS